MRLLSSLSRRVFEHKSISSTNMMLTLPQTSGDPLGTDLDRLRSPHSCTLICDSYSPEMGFGASKRERFLFRGNMPSPKDPSLCCIQRNVTSPSRAQIHAVPTTASCVPRFSGKIVASEPELALTR